MTFGNIKTQVFVVLKRCKVCGMLFITSSLQNHKRNHTQSQNAKCLLYLLHLSQRKKLLDSSSTTPEIRSQVPGLSKLNFFSISPFGISLLVRPLTSGLFSTVEINGYCRGWTGPSMLLPRNSQSRPKTVFFLWFQAVKFQIQGKPNEQLSCKSCALFFPEVLE